MRIFLLLEGIITLDLMWKLAIESNRNEYGLIIGGMSIHYIIFMLKCILMSRKINRCYYWIGVLVSESICLGILNLKWRNEEELVEILVLIQIAWMYNHDIFYTPSLIAMLYSVILQYFKNFSQPLHVIQISVVFCLFLLAAYYSKSIQRPNEMNRGNTIKLIDITIRPLCDASKILEEMPWLTDQNFFVLNEKLTLIFQQMHLESLMECPQDNNPEYNESEWLELFFQSQCESLSKNLISILPKRNQKKHNLRQICSTIIEFDKSFQQYYSVADTDAKVLKLQDYKINIIEYFSNQEKVLVIHLEQLLENQTKNKKYFNAISIQQNNSVNSQSQSQNTTQNSILSNIFQSVSHEFGTYLNCILSVSEEAIACQKITQELKDDYFEPIFINSQLLSYILRSIRDYNTIMLNQFVLRLQEFSPKEKIKEIIKLMNKQLECRGNTINKN